MRFMRFEFFKQAAKGVGYVTTLTAATCWAAEQDLKQKKELEKANPNHDVVEKFVPSAMCGGYFKYELVPKKSESPQMRK